jgi:hypothetical protein
MSSIDRINDLLEPSLVYLTAATVDSILALCEESKIYENKAASEQFVAFCLIAAVTNKKATTRDIADDRFKALRPFVNSHFMLNNSINNSVISLAGLTFMTIKAVQEAKWGKSFKKKFGKTHPWEDTSFAANVSEKQKEILQQKISKCPFEDAKRFRNEFLTKSGISNGKSTVGSST